VVTPAAPTKDMTVLVLLLVIVVGKELLLALTTTYCITAGPEEE
jgi:hypothetical protein